MNGAKVATGGSSFSRPLFFYGDSGLKGGAGNAALALISDNLASGKGLLVAHADVAHFWR